MRKTSILSLAVLAAGAAAGTVIYLKTQTPRGADAEDPELVALGRMVYAANCAECHGKNLEGEPNWRQRKPDGKLPAPPHDETGHTWHHPDDLLFDYTKRGGTAIAIPGFESGMPGFGDSLSDREIWAVLAFIKSRWPENIQRRQEQMNRATR